MALHKDVFKQQIWKFFQNDIDSCLIVSKDLQTKIGNLIFKGGLNFTAALTILVVIEMCASYYSGKEVDDNKVTEFINKYFSKYEPIFHFEPICKKLFQVFKHGLAHNWSPKMAGVSMDFELDKSVVFVKGTPVLNIPSFYEVVKKGISDYEKDLDNTQQLRDLFEKRYTKIISFDKTEVDKLNELFSSLLNKPTIGEL